MPTREVLVSFWRVWDRLTPQQQRAFRAALVQFIAGLNVGGQAYSPVLRVKRVQGITGVPKSVLAQGDERFHHAGTSRSAIA